MKRLAVLLILLGGCMGFGPAQGGGTSSAAAATLTFEAHAADDTLSTSETGSVHANSGAATRTITLPPGAPQGTHYYFVGAVASQELRVDPSPNDKFVGAQDTLVWTDGEYMKLDCGDSVHVVADASGDWVILGYSGTLQEEIGD